MATTSNRSSGSQVNKRGVAQGVTLVDPKSGLPISTVVDLDGTIKLAVDASVTATIGDVILNPSTSGVYIADKTSGYRLKVNADGTLDANVEVDAADGDNIAIHDSAGHELKVNTDGSINISGSISGTVNTNLNGLNTFQTSQYSVGTSAVQLTLSPLGTRSSVSIKVVTSTDTEKVYVGNSSAVTTSTGYPLFNGDSIQLDLTPAQQIWVIGTAAGQKVAVLELGS